MTSGGWSYELTNTAERGLRKLTQQDRGRVLDALDRLVADPFSAQADVRKLAGRTGEYRLRVGELRVRYMLDPVGRIVVVLVVAPRGSAYRD